MYTTSMRQRDGKWETEDVFECSTYVDAEYHINECLEFAKDHIDVEFDVTCNPDYGDDHSVRARLTGWRYSTEKEIADKEAEDAKWAKKIRETEEAQVVKLRKSRPELFK